MSINLQQVVQLIEETDDLRVPVLHESSWYTSTWLCSHIAIVSILIAAECTFEQFLADVVKRDLSCAYYSPQEWLAKSEVRPASQTELLSHLAHAQADLLEAKSDDTYEYPHVEIPLNQHSMEPLHSAYRISGNNHRYGPTYIYLWCSGDWFHYFEIHNES